MEEIAVTITVNGTTHQVRTPSNSTLLDMLRNGLGLTGTKNGCAEGECGACTVILDGKVVNSCLVFAWQADGHDVVTIEGLSENGKLHTVQQVFLDIGAVQCGFCTPGTILSAVALLERNPTPNERQIRESLSGNLCRCTGYSKIVKAVQVAAEEMRHGRA